MVVLAWFQGLINILISFPTAERAGALPNTATRQKMGICNGNREGLLTKFRRKAFSVTTFDSPEFLDTSGGTMKRSLYGWQLMLLGIGTMASELKAQPPLCCRSTKFAFKRTIDPSPSATLIVLVSRLLV